MHDKTLPTKSYIDKSKMDESIEELPLNLGGGLNTVDAAQRSGDALSRTICYHDECEGTFIDGSSQAQIDGNHKTPEVFMDGRRRLIRKWLMAEQKALEAIMSMKKELDKGEESERNKRHEKKDNHGRAPAQNLGEIEENANDPLGEMYMTEKVKWRTSIQHALFVYMNKLNEIKQCMTANVFHFNFCAKQRNWDIMNRFVDMKLQLTPLYKERPGLGGFLPGNHEHLLLPGPPMKLGEQVTEHFPIAIEALNSMNHSQIEYLARVYNHDFAIGCAMGIIAWRKKFLQFITSRVTPPCLYA